MSETGVTWGLAYTQLDGKPGSRFEWHNAKPAWPNQQDAEYRAKSGSLVFSEPSDFREPHPSVAGAVLLIERFFVFVVYPIHGGDHAASSRRATDGVSKRWLENLRPTDGGHPTGPPGSGGSPHLDAMNAALETAMEGGQGLITPEIESAYEALRIPFVERRYDDSVVALCRAAGPAYRGVAYAFFRNLIEYKFAGTEHRLAIERYLRGVAGFSPVAMQGTDIPLMARFIVDQTGAGKPRLGRTNIAGLDLDRFQDDALAAAIAIGSFEGLTGDEILMRLQGAVGRYAMGRG
ncbi:hypothetical protein [Nocardia sp. NPDC004722]